MFHLQQHSYFIKGCNNFFPCLYLPSVNDFIHSQEQSLHILQQSPPLNIFSVCERA